MSDSLWFIAVLVRGARVHSEAPTQPLTDLDFVLIQAVDAEAAYREALAIGAAGNHSYPNSEGQEVSWEFLGLHDLREISESKLASGAEVYSFVSRRDPRRLVAPKERLTEFWLERNADRTIEDILGDIGCSDLG